MKARLLSFHPCHLSLMCSLDPYDGRFVAVVNI